MISALSAPQGPLWVGIDLGTQSVRTVISDERGRVMGLGSAPLRSRRHPGRRHEQDAGDWWRAVGEASRQARARLSAELAAVPVGAVAICSTSGTVLLTDPSGTPTTPALMYDDARAEAEAGAIREATGGADVQLSWALPKISRLLADHRRDGDGSPVRVAHSADVIAAALTGHRVDTDTSHALKSGYDLVGGAWDQMLLAAADIDPAVLPDVVRPGSPLGSVSAEAAEHTGLPEGTMIVAGMTDGCAAQIAAGALTPGSWNSVLGTTLILKGVSTELLTDPGGAIYSHRHPDGGWLPGGASNVGAGALTHQFPHDDLDALTRAALAFEPASGVVYPLTERGERFPFVDPSAVGFEVGTFSGAAERFAGMLQGVAYVERLCFERLASIGADVTGPVTATGGAVRNDHWTQLRADVLGVPLHLPEIIEPSFGMAVLASARHDTVTARAGAMVRIRRTVDPRPASRGLWDSGYHHLVDELSRRGYLPATVTLDTTTGGPT